MALFYYFHNYTMLILVLSAAVGLTLSSPWESPRLSRDNPSRHINPFYTFDGANPVARNFSCSIKPFLSTSRPFCHCDSASSYSTTPTSPTIIVGGVQAATDSTPTRMLPPFTDLQVSGLVSSSAESTGTAGASSTLTISSAPKPGTTSLVHLIESLAIPPAPSPVITTSRNLVPPLQTSDISITSPIASSSIYTSPVPASTVAEPTSLFSVTTPLATQTSSLSLNADSSYPTMAVTTSSSSFESPEVGPKSSDGPSLAVTGPVEVPPTSINSATFENVGPSSTEPEPTTFRTEVSSGITTPVSASSVEVASAAASDVCAIIYMLALLTYLSLPLVQQWASQAI